MVTKNIAIASIASALGLMSAPAAPESNAGVTLPIFNQPAEIAEGEVFDLSLDDAIAIIRQRSFRAARSERSLEQSELRYRNAKAQYLPRLSTNLNVDQSARGYSYDSERFEFEQRTRGEFRGSANGDLSMPLDLAGVIRRQVRQADLSRDISGNDLANTTLDVTLEVRSAYLNALRAQNQLDAEEGVATQIEQLLERNGSGSSVAPFLEVELANARQAAQNSRENADNAQDGLKQLLRVPPEVRLRLTSNVSAQKQEFDRGELLARALSARPDIQSALLRVKAAETSIRQASDFRKPTVRIGGYVNEQISGRSLITDDRDRFSSKGLGVSMNVPFLQWDNGQLRRNRKVAEIQRDQAMADVDELRERVSYEVRQQLLAVTRAENRIRTLPDPKQAAEALARAEQALLAAPADSRQGLLAQVTNARQAWRSAQTATADAYIDYNNAVFRLERLVGQGAEPGIGTVAGQSPIAKSTAK